MGGGRSRGGGPPGRLVPEPESRDLTELCMDLLTEDQITGRLAGTPGWTRTGGEIEHVATLADFTAAMLYVNAIAYLAEKANHHPDISIGWNKVTLTLSTHSAGGLTENDFALAAQINALG